MCAGGGGALLGFASQFDSSFDATLLEAGGKGWGGLAKTLIQWSLGRPSLYALPSAIPWLHLGEMVYHPATEPRSMSAGSTALLQSAMRLQPRAVAARRALAAELGAMAIRAYRLGLVSPILGAEPGYLRYAVRDLSSARRPDAKLGVLRPYPQTLAEQPELADVLEEGEPATPGATELRRTLFTLPTHHFVTPRDVNALGLWMSNDRASGSRTAIGSRDRLEAHVAYITPE
jgi:hypothetical protein